MPLRRGKPKPWAFSGLFLPSLAWELNVEEIPLRELEADTKTGTLIRHMRRRQGQPSADLLRPQLRSSLKQAPLSQQKEVMTRALDGNAAALETVEHMGMWECVCAGGLTAWPHPLEYARLEALSVDADKALSQHDFPTASELVRTCPELKLFWSDAALHALAASTSAKDTLAPRLAAYLELQMYCLALTSVKKLYAKPQVFTEGEFDPVIQPDGLPGKHLMRFLLRYYRQSSQKGLLDAAASCVCVCDGDDDQLPSTVTLKRWFSGQIFPPQNAVAPLLLALIKATHGHTLTSPSNTDLSTRDPKRLFLAARRVNSTVKLAGVLLNEAQNRHLLGAETGGQWAVGAYQRWVGYWQKATASQPPHALPPS